MPSKWALVGLAVLFSAVIILLGYLYLTSQVKAIREANFEQLTSIAHLKVGEIKQWRSERLGDLHVIAQSPLFQDATSQLAANPADSALRETIQNRLKSLREYYAYADCMLTFPDGALLLSLDPEKTKLEAESARLAREAADGQSWRFGDFFRSEVDGRIYIDLAGPVLDARGRTAAVLLLRVNPESYLFPLIQEWPVPSQSAETLLVREQNGSALYLNTLRHRDDPPLTLRIPPGAVQVPAIMAVNGVTGQVEGVDYRGVKVIAVIKPIPDSNWMMISKVDESEIMAEVVSVGRYIFLLVVMGVLSAAILLTLIYNNRQRLLYRSLNEANQGRLNALEEIRTILYSIGDGVIATDDRGRVTHFNPVAEELTGWKESEAAGKDLTEVFPIINETTRQPVENPVQRVLREGVVVGLANHTLLIRRDGRASPIADSGAPVRNEKGETDGVVLVFRDQTKEREAQRERAILTRAISSSLDEIYIFDADTLKFLYINNGALENLRFSMEEMLEKTPIDIKPEIDPAVFEDIIRPLKDGSRPMQIFETVHQRRDGSRYPVEVHLQYFEAEGLRLFMAIIQDITERRKIEGEIRNLNAQLEQRVQERTVDLEASNRELEAFAYSISHDLRAPLRGIDGWSQALLEDNLEQLDETGRQYLMRVRGETQRMGAMIDDLLNLSRVTRSEMVLQNVDLTGLANTIIARLRENDGRRRVEVEVAQGLAVRGDPQLIEIALTNLLDNAWKFSSQRDPARIEFGRARVDGRDAFFVRDNGSGFDMKHSSKLFGAFQRLHKQSEFPGTGVGLASVQRIIRRHGGNVWYQARPDEGATFFFTFWEAG